MLSADVTQTSRLFGIGKGSAVKVVQNGTTFRAVVQILSKSGLKAAEVEQAGERALVCLYGGKKTETLNELRARMFSEKVTTSASSVQVKSLPPTSDAAKNHSRRVYLLAQVWMGSEDLSPSDWGWQLLDERLQLRKMDSLPAPEFLLKIIRCQYKGVCDNLQQLTNTANPCLQYR
jgi:hypothetical protein